MKYPLEYIPKKPEIKYIDIEIGAPLGYEIGKVEDEKKGIFWTIKYFKEFDDAINFVPPVGAKYWLLENVRTGRARVDEEGIHPITKSVKIYIWNGTTWIMDDKFRKKLGTY